MQPVQTSATKPHVQAVTRFRSTAFRAIPQKVEREALLISGAALCSRGEAVGHGLWLDSAFIDQITEQARAFARGLKARFTHPGLCADGLGTYLGRWKDCRRDGDVLRGTLHLSEIAHTTPKGNLAGYVLDLAEDDPGAFGASIVFQCDQPAMDQFMLDHGGRWEEDGFGNRFIVGFESSDPDNVNHWPHARSAKLFGCDVVDEPAANPAGFFGRGDELAGRASAVLAWLFDLPSAVKPDPAWFGGLEPDRARSFVCEWLAQRNLAVIPNHRRTPKPSPVKPAQQRRGAIARASTAPKLEQKPEFPCDRATLKKTFPDASRQFVLACLTENLCLSEAKDRWDHGAEQLETPPVQPTVETASSVSFEALIEEFQTRENCSRTTAIRLAAREHPDRHRAWLEE